MATGGRVEPTGLGTQGVVEQITNPEAALSKSQWKRVSRAAPNDGPEQVQDR